MEEFKIGDKVFSPRMLGCLEHGNGCVRLVEPNCPRPVRVSFENGFWKAFTGKNKNVGDILCHGWLIATGREETTLKEEMPRYRHFKGNEYTLLHDDVIDSDVGPDAMPDAVYIGKDGVKWRRPATEFYGYKGTNRRFTPIKKES